MRMGGAGITSRGAAVRARFGSRDRRVLTDESGRAAGTASTGVISGSCSTRGASGAVSKALFAPASEAVAGSPGSAAWVPRGMTETGIGRGSVAGSRSIQMPPPPAIINAPASTAAATSVEDGRLAERPSICGPPCQANGVGPLAGAGVHICVPVLTAVVALTRSVDAGTEGRAPTIVAETPLVSERSAL